MKKISQERRKLLTEAKKYGNIDRQKQRGLVVLKEGWRSEILQIWRSTQEAEGAPLLRE